MKLSKALVCLAVGLVVSLGATPVLQAQSATTGSLSGLVTDAEGSTALPGAQISVVHQPTSTRYSSLSGADGRFRIANVKVGGPYAVSVAMDGFHPQKKENVRVRLGQDTSLSFLLPLATVSETLTVVGESTSLITSSRTGAASNVSLRAIEELPTVLRGLEDFARTNPFFAVGAENEDPDAISVAGRSSRYNNIQIDGSVNNDLFGLADTGTPGGQAGTAPISLDAIQEVQLVLANFDVRQGGFSGGSINAITRSGSNKLKGSLFFFTRDNGDFGDGPDELGKFGDFSEDQYGFRLGGPISQDKVFFFINADIEERTSPTGWSIDGSSGQTFGFVDEANRFRDILINQYGYDPGPLTENSIDNPSDKYFGRIDFNLADNHNLTLRHNFVDAADVVNRPGSFAYEWPTEGYNFISETNSTVVQLNSTLSNTKFNELRVAVQTIKDRRFGDTEPFPHIEIENLGPPGCAAAGTCVRAEFETGTEQFSTRNALDQDVFELTNDFTWLKGDHTFTFGTHNEFFSFDNLFIQNAFGSYEFSNLDDFEAGIANDWDYTVVVPGQADAQSFKVEQIGLYFGDQYRVKDNLTISYGLRVDIPSFPDKPTSNPLTQDLYGFSTSEIPDGNELWQPRLGFNWDPEGDGRSQLRGGVGVFAGRTPYVWISNQYGRTGIEQ
ncbi:MAG: carboxypeptidase regulatory-like domain-containing protein, partial [Acidobacteria bacterium]|nr:carboxypeptidase regulatory-like domain-containing protein [Acidobacteriota bacterium]